MTCDSPEEVLKLANARAKEIDLPVPLGNFVEFECQDGFEFLYPEVQHEIMCGYDGKWEEVEQDFSCSCMYKQFLCVYPLLYEL